MNIINIFSTPMWENIFPTFKQDKHLYLNEVEKNNLGEVTNDNVCTNAIFNSLSDYICQMSLKAAFDLQLKNVYAAITRSSFIVTDKNQHTFDKYVSKDTLSGIFYLKVPENPGKLVIKNPGINHLWKGLENIDTKNKFTSQHLRISPSEGQVFLWPSYLQYSFEEDNLEETTISLSFNVLLFDQELINKDK